MASIAPVDVKAGYWFSGHDSRSVSDIPSEHYTHLYARFAEVNPVDGGLDFPGNYRRDFESFTTTVRRRNPEVKTLLSIGGDDAAEQISQVMRDERKRGKFIENSINLARNFNFDGLDLCWLYPSPSDNRADLISFLNEWRAAVEAAENTIAGSTVQQGIKPTPENTNNVQSTLLLTAAVFHHPFRTGQNHVGSFYYPCHTINEKLDWINVLAKDFYTPETSREKTGPVHAWLTRPEDLNRPFGSDGIGHWINNGVATQKLVLCLPFYGYEWTLTDSNNFGLFAPAAAASANIKIMTYRNIKRIINENNYERKTDEDYFAAYAYKKKNWIGYEDEISISKKVIRAVRKNNLRGYAAWDVGADDETWSLSRAAFDSIQSPVPALAPTLAAGAPAPAPAPAPALVARATNTGIGRGTVTG